MSMFKKGYEVAKEQAEKQAENKGKKLFNFFIRAASKENPDAEAEVQFLNEEPINFMAHGVRTFRGGKEIYDTVVCYPEDNCSICQSERAKPMAAYLLFDKRPYTQTDPIGKVIQVIEGQLRLYLVGMKIVTQLSRLSNRYGLTKSYFNIVRNGSGTSTTYSFEKGDPVEESAKAVLEANLPEALKEGYKDVYQLLSDQLMMLIPKGSAPDDDDDEEEVEKPTKKTFVSIEDDDDEIEDDDGEIVVWKTPKPSSAKAMFRKKG